MTKSEFVDQVADRAGLSKRDAGEAVDAVLETIESTLSRGSEVVFSGFGKFSVSNRSAREGRNPATGERIQIAATRVPKFTPGAGLLRILRLVGGAFIVFLAVTELRSLARRRSGTPEVAEAGALSPTAKGVVSVVVNPGAWVFFATTASAVVAAATVDGGTRAALAAAVAMTVGVSVSAEASGTGSPPRWSIRAFRP